MKNETRCLVVDYDFVMLYNTEQERKRRIRQWSICVQKWRYSDNMEYVYMLKCCDGSLYTGWTNDIKKRFAAHCAGRGAKYTRGRGPLTLVYLEIFDDRTDAQRREAAIKRLKRAEKLMLVSDGCIKEAAEIMRQVNGSICR